MTQFRDQDLMKSTLYELKHEVSTLCQAAMESNNSNLRSQYTQILSKSLDNQKKFFDLMNQKGFYKVENAPQEQFSRTQQSLSSMQQQMQQPSMQ